MFPLSACCLCAVSLSFFLREKRHQVRTPLGNSAHPLGAEQAPGIGSLLAGRPDWVRCHSWRSAQDTLKFSGGGFSQQLRNPRREPAPRKPFPKQDSKLLLTISFQSLTRARSLHPAAGVRTRVTACDTHTSSPNLRDGPKGGSRGGPGCPRLQSACQGSCWGS